MFLLSLSVVLISLLFFYVTFAMDPTDRLSECLENVRSIAGAVECFLHGEKKAVKTMLDCAECISNLSLRESLTSLNSRPGPKKANVSRNLVNGISADQSEQLHVQNFDLEQVWQMIHMSNEPMFQLMQSKTKKMNITDLSTMKKSTNSPIDLYVEKSRKIPGEKLKDITSNHENIPDDQEEDYEGFESDGSVSDSRKNEKANKSHSRSVVDDGFFVLDEMNRFLENEDKKFERGSKDQEDETSSSDEIDYFDDQLADSNSMDELDNAFKKSSELMSR